MLSNLVPARDTEVDTALTDKRGYVGGREKDEGDGQVLHQCDIEAGMAVEENVGASEEVKSCFIQAALFL